MATDRLRTFSTPRESAAIGPVPWAVIERNNPSIVSPKCAGNQPDDHGPVTTWQELTDYLAAQGHDPIEIRHALEERTGIREFDGEQSRLTATIAAGDDVWRMFATPRTGGQ